MKTTQPLAARKRPVNLTLSESLVNQARGLTDNLSSVVETLLADYVEAARQERINQSRVTEKTIAVWNDFNVKVGSFADEYSTL
jgi:hypothetical protein